MSGAISHAFPDKSQIGKLIHKLLLSAPVLHVLVLARRQKLSISLVDSHIHLPKKQLIPSLMK
jgi:hypothetical protein